MASALKSRGRATGRSPQATGPSSTSISAMTSRSPVPRTRAARDLRLPLDRAAFRRLGLARRRRARARARVPAPAGRPRRRHARGLRPHDRHDPGLVPRPRGRRRQRDADRARSRRPPALRRRPRRRGHRPAVHPRCEDDLREPPGVASAARGRAHHEGHAGQARRARLRPRDRWRGAPRPHHGRRSQCGRQDRRQDDLPRPARPPQPCDRHHPGTRPLRSLRRRNSGSPHAP